MSVSFNKVIIAGNLARDPELRYTPSGKAVVNITVAVNDYYSQSASFFRVVVWDKMAENVSKYLGKGSSVLVEGRLQTNSYETQSGEKRSSVEIVAQNVQFLSTKRNDGYEQSSIPGNSVKSESVIKDEIEKTVDDSEFYNEENDDDVPF